MWFSLEKCVTPSLKGMRRDVDMTATLSCGGMDGLSEHNTPNSDYVSRANSVGTFAR